MREVSAETVAEVVAELFIEANYSLGEDVLEALRRAREEEPSPLGREVLERLLENADTAHRERAPLCQDCGTAVVYVTLGQDVHVIGGSLEEAVQEGVRRGYGEGYLRRSIVEHPFTSRTNTGDNTPAVVHYEVVPGDRLRVEALPKGAGCENMTRLFMLTPAQGREGIVRAAVSTVEEAGSNPCPPTILCVGIGGTAEKAMLLAKKAQRRPVGQPHPDEEVATLEGEILEKANALGIGPQGYGGRTTLLAVHVETFPTHIGSLPVAVTFQCHSARYKEAEV